MTLLAAFVNWWGGRTVASAIFVGVVIAFVAYVLGTVGQGEEWGATVAEGAAYTLALAYIPCRLLVKWAWGRRLDGRDSGPLVRALSRVPGEAER